MFGLGNYFVEFGVFEFGEVLLDFGLEFGIYVVFLSYSGSCGVGVVVCLMYSVIV